MKRLFLLGVAICMSWVLALATYGADVNCYGRVIDEQGEPLIGAMVTVPGTRIGVSTDLDGTFSLKAPSGKTLKITYVGYSGYETPVKENIGDVVLKPETKMLQDVVVTQSKARTRETPIAMSEITAAQIEAKLGNKEFPEVLKMTPGVWATPEGGGYGDAKINMRGFKAPNVAVLVNGIPMNDMEWGGIYWSNFAGLGGVTTSMQTQRGLGAAIISSPSIGGTINITTKGLDAKKGGSVWYGMGNNALNDVGFSVSTGLMKNGWAISILGSRKWGDGYIQGTQFEELFRKRIEENRRQPPAFVDSFRFSSVAQPAQYGVRRAFNRELAAGKGIYERQKHVQLQPPVRFRQRGTPAHGLPQPVSQAYYLTESYLADQ